jgi:soluble lytic murein transglycosylase-like protein
MNRGSEAKAIYSALADDDNLSYYALLSLKRLEKLEAPTQAPRRGAAQGLPRLKVPAPFALGQVESANGQESLLRLKELLLVGLWEDFLAELDSLAATETVHESFADIRDDNGSTAQDSGAWNQKFPPAYATLVTLFTQTRRIPPALAWAIMREESRFRPQVVSAANAIGLMQIIPPTGSEIAAYLRRSSFSPEDLYRPVVNVEYGVQYLAMNLKRFSGNMIETIASYNAGPEAVERWKKARPGRDWEEFVEEIPYAETQEYVRKVLRSFYLYSLLYGLEA